MADSSADFSKIVELQEIKRLYDEAQDRHQQEVTDKERTIQNLNEQLRSKESELIQVQESTAGTTDAVDKARKETAFVKKEMEGKIAKLQARVKELTANDAVEPDSGTGRRGFFSR